MPERPLLIEVEAGRNLAVEVVGPADGEPVVFHHGTPSCRLDLPVELADLDRLGIRLISFDRAGYGRSAPQPTRNVASVAADVAAIVDQLGVERFTTIGVSGGGPHALATAAVLGDRVRRVCVSVGLGPVGSDGFDGSEGMLPETREEIMIARGGEAPLRAFVAGCSDPEVGLDGWLRQLPPSDQAVLSRATVRDREQVVAREWQALSLDGWVHDDLALFTRPWGFELTQVKQPTLLVYGDADVLVPLEHGEKLAALLPQATLRIVPGGGHWLEDQHPPALAWLAQTHD